MAGSPVPSAPRADSGVRRRKAASEHSSRASRARRTAVRSTAPASSQSPTTTATRPTTPADAPPSSRTREVPLVLIARELPAHLVDWMMAQHAAAVESVEASAAAAALGAVNMAVSNTAAVKPSASEIPHYCTRLAGNPRRECIVLRETADLSSHLAYLFLITCLFLYSK